MARTYRWQDLSDTQHNAARTIRDRLAGEGWGITVSQLVKHFDETMQYARGERTAQSLAELCAGAARVDPQ